MGRPAGSPNKDKPFRDALRMEIAAAQDENDFRSLRKVARSLLEKAAAGDVQASREIADRLDGKVPQAIVGDDEHDPVNVLAKIERVIVENPSDRDGKSIPPST